jgi:hypothetical protein
MESKISDFRIAEAVLRKMCKSEGVHFVDAPLNFDETQDGLFIGGSQNIAHTIYKIVAEFINNSEAIVGRSLLGDEQSTEGFLTLFASKLRSFIYKDNRYKPLREPHISHLYQRSLVWILMKDLICPVFDRDLRNLRVVCSENPYLDIARYYEEGQFEIGDAPNYEFISLNNIDNAVIQSAMLSLEALRAHDLSPLEVMARIYDSDLYDKYRGLLEIALGDADADDFEAMILVGLGVNLRGLLPQKYALSQANVKTAQNLYPGTNVQWWQKGVLEKMIEPIRGSDWRVHRELQPYVEEFWNTVEALKRERKKRGHDEGVPFDVLLRLKQKQNVEFKADPSRTLQALLSSDRVW